MRTKPVPVVRKPKKKVALRKRKPPTKEQMEEFKKEMAAEMEAWEEEKARSIPTEDEYCSEISEDRAEAPDLTYISIRMPYVILQDPYLPSASMKLVYTFLLELDLIHGEVYLSYREIGEAVGIYDHNKIDRILQHLSFYDYLEYTTTPCWLKVDPEEEFAPQDQVLCIWGMLTSFHIRERSRKHPEARV